MKLHALISVAETSTPGVYNAEVDITDKYGDRYNTIYGVVPEDTFGLSPQVVLAVAEWIAEGKPVAPYVPPTSEQLRQAMPSLSARQLRLGLIANGVSLATVQTAIENISDPAEREIAQVEWEYATTFERTHTLISQIGTAMSLTPEQIDAMWSTAISM